MSTAPIVRQIGRFAGLSELTSRIALSSKLEPLCLIIRFASSHVAADFTTSGVTAHNLLWAATLQDRVVKYQCFEIPINLSTVHPSAWDLNCLQAKFTLGRQHYPSVLQYGQLLNSLPDWSVSVSPISGGPFLFQLLSDLHSLFFGQYRMEVSEPLSQ